jgi:hypothetical protein
MQVYNIDMYLNMGGSLELNNWRTLTPVAFYSLISQLIQRRLT